MSIVSWVPKGGHPSSPPQRCSSTFPGRMDQLGFEPASDYLTGNHVPIYTTGPHIDVRSLAALLLNKNAPANLACAKLERHRCSTSSSLGKRLLRTWKKSNFHGNRSTRPVACHGSRSSSATRKLQPIPLVGKRHRQQQHSQ